MNLCTECIENKCDESLDDNNLKNLSMIHAAATLNPSEWERWNKLQNEIHANAKRDWTFEQKIKFDVYSKLAATCTNEMVRIAYALNKDRENKEYQAEHKTWLEAFDMLWGICDKITPSSA